jgi:hypothetical protein
MFSFINHKKKTILSNHINLHTFFLKTNCINLHKDKIKTFFFYSHFLYTNFSEMREFKMLGTQLRRS